MSYRSLYGGIHRARHRSPAAAALTDPGGTHRAGDHDPARIGRQGRGRSPPGPIGHRDPDGGQPPDGPLPHLAAHAAGLLAQGGHLDDERTAGPAATAVLLIDGGGRPVTLECSSDIVGSVLTGSVGSVEVLVEEALGVVDPRPSPSRVLGANDVSPPSPISTLGKRARPATSHDPAWTVFIVRSRTISKLASFWSA